MPATEVELLELQLAAYDEGYDDALAGNPRKDAGDLQLDYDAGYSDGLEDRDYVGDYMNYIWVEDDEGSYK
jgi:hypothetical protein